MPTIKIDVRDNVVVDVSTGMKYAECGIRSGETVIKYGSPIGVASEDIDAGALVHTHNLASVPSRGGSVAFRPYPLPDVRAGGTFSGYRRASGTGIRNDVFIVPAVGCVNGLCERLAARTGAIALTHPFGCSQLHEDLDNTRRILRGLILNPNAAGVLVVSLGCENNTPESFRAFLDEWGYERDRVRFMTAQDVPDETETGLSHIAGLQMRAKQDRREACDLSGLTVGLKCGGSDGLSGITANPLVGDVADRIIACGGRVVLTEIPEAFGAEDELLSRCADRETFDRLNDVFDGFRKYYADHGERTDENPSPGNKAGGITTLAEKSLGCIRKGGHAPVTDVLGYGDRVRRAGLTVLNGPGNDLVATTALAAAGCQLVLFTTGRGTPLGGAVPVVKISSNTALAERKPGWIDFDAGRILREPRAAAADALFGLILDVASGRPTKSERNGCREIAVWKTGVTL